MYGFVLYYCDKKTQDIKKAEGPFEGYVTHGFCSVSRDDFEIETEAIPLKLSQEVGSISSTDTSEIGFSLPACAHQASGQPFAAHISQKKEQSNKRQKGRWVASENNMLCYCGSVGFTTKTHLFKVNKTVYQFSNMCLVFDTLPNLLSFLSNTEYQEIQVIFTFN